MTVSANDEPRLMNSALTAVVAAFSAGLFLLLFGRSLIETFTICWNNEDYSHGLLLPFFAAYLIYRSPRPSPGRTESSSVPLSIWGVVLLVTGLFLLFLGTASDLLFFSWLGFFPGALGLLFLLIGPAASLPYIGPLLLNFMAKPLPDSLVPKLFFPLQVLAARAAAWSLDLLQVPVYLRGNVIEIPGMQLMVEEACSGLRSLMALLTVAIIVLLTLELPRAAKALILVLAVVVAVALNVLRVTLTGILAYFVDHRAASGFFHTFSGLVVFVAGLLILSGIGAFIERRTRREAR